MRVLQKAIVRFNTSLSLIKIRHRYNESRVKNVQLSKELIIISQLKLGYLALCKEWNVTKIA